MVKHNNDGKSKENIKLDKYKSKRNFNKTAEPSGNKKFNEKELLSFVVQHHLARRDHFDFRLEWNGVMLSWAVPKGPTYNSNEKRLAIKVEDHPLDYQNFEGTIPKGEYGGGTVMIWDNGFWESEKNVEESLKNGTIKFELFGNRLKGSWALIKLKAKENEKQEQWLLIKEKDKFVNIDYDINIFDTSIETGRTMKEIETNENKEIKANFNELLKNLNITNPDKIMFARPKITKKDIIEYYLKVGERMLPYVQNRVLNLVRCPGGIAKSCFFKKHPESQLEGVGSIDVKNKDNVSKPYSYIQNAIGLLTQAQMNTIEFHTWGSKIETINVPDMMVFDLDPDEGVDLEQIRQGAKGVKNALEDLNLKSYLKTSGGKGYHIVVHFKQEFSWEEFSLFSKRIALLLESKFPSKYTSNIRKNKREGKIFIDWQRNGKGATSVAPYSLRAREGCCVSMPISWNELDEIAPNDIDIFKAVERLKKKDPWEDFFD